MSETTETTVAVRRVNVTSDRPFDDVVAAPSTPVSVESTISPLPWWIAAQLGGDQSDCPTTDSGQPRPMSLQCSANSASLNVG